jgi:hypothetical protein
LTREGAPFAEHEGLKMQVEGTREELLLAVERWRCLVEVGRGRMEVEVEKEAVLRQVKRVRYSL